MIRKVTLVPKDKCPLDVLAEMGAQTETAWIFLHENAVEKLRTTADTVTSTITFLKMYWKETEKYPSTTIMLERKQSLSVADAGYSKWYKVRTIDADDIAFKSAVSDPEQLFFFQMEE